MRIGPKRLLARQRVGLLFQNANHERIDAARIGMPGVLRPWDSTRELLYCWPAMGTVATR